MTKTPVIYAVLDALRQELAQLEDEMKNDPRYRKIELLRELADLYREGARRPRPVEARTVANEARHKFKFLPAADRNRGQEKEIYNWLAAMDRAAKESLHLNRNSVKAGNA